MIRVVTLKQFGVNLIRKGINMILKIKEAQKKIIDLVFRSINFVRNWKGVVSKIYEDSAHSNLIISKL